MSNFDYPPTTKSAPPPSSSSPASKSSRNPESIRFKKQSSSGTLPLWLLLLLVAFELCCFRSSCEDRQQQAADHSTPTRKNHSSTVSSSSELIFEHLSLKEIPQSSELCPNGAQNNPLKHINSISFAFNQINSIGPNAFSCLAQRLRILNLRRNRIESIAQDAFAGLEQLQVLLLDGNQLARIPSKSFEPLVSLRHLNLASNQIESIGGRAAKSAAADEDQLQTKNLISLNLRANPLRRISPGSFKQLVRLKTLILSETQLELGDKVDPPSSSNNKLIPFEGLNELRFLHLDHLNRAKNEEEATKNATSIQLDREFCAHSKRLTSLILRSNGLVEIPQFSNCQNLLQLDLTFNRLTGSLDGHFRLQVNLIDLYLANNMIETLEENAFLGLDRLQVLNLQQNRLKFIHSRAFLPLGSSLLELNVGQNSQLEELPSIGLADQLRHLKAFGNHALRSLPRFKAAKSLTLTYAYHCCDYLSASRDSDLDDPGNSPIDGPPTQDGESSSPSSFNILALIRQFLNSLSAASTGQQHRNQIDSMHDEEYLQQQQHHSTNLKNLSEFIVWSPRQTMETTTPPVTSGEQSAPENLIHLNENIIKSSSVDGRKRREIPASSSSNLALKSNLVSPEDEGDKLHEKSGNKNERGLFNLIDELVFRLAKIRKHSDLNEPQQHEQLDSLSAVVVLGGMKLNDDQADELMEFPGVEATTEADMNGNMLGGDDGGQFVLHQVRLRMAQLYDDKTTFSSSAVMEPSNSKSNHNKRHTTNHAAAAEQEQPQQESNVSPPTTTATTDSIQPQQQPQQIQCQPKPNAFMPCRDLFDHWWLRSSVWLVFLCSFLGNILVIVVLTSVRSSSSSSALTSIMWFQAHSKRHIDVPRFLVINLAIADLLMACYLGLLACVDLVTWNKFKYFAIKWQYSSGCRLAGFLAVLSSELSVFILAIITLERNYAITNAVHLNRRLSLQKAALIMLLGYSFALVMASMPLNGISDYRKYSICLPGLDFHQSNLRSQVYLVALISINTFSFLLLLSCYLRMYCAIRGSQAWNTNDLRIAKRMSILVLTDFLCWMPIIVVSISSLFGHNLIGPNGLKVLTVFVLPLNSVANPFLYAITTKKFKRDLVTLRRRFSSMICSLVSLCCCCCCWCCRSCGCGKHYNQNHQHDCSAGDSMLHTDKLNNHHHQQHLLRLHLNNEGNKLLFSSKGGQFNSVDKKKRRFKNGQLVDNVRFQNKDNRAQRQQHFAHNKRRFRFDSDGDDEDDEKQRKGREMRNDWRNKGQINTNNQVTMNRTTCSCGHRAANAAETTKAQAEPTTATTRRQVAIQVKLDGSSHLAVDPNDCVDSSYQLNDRDSPPPLTGLTKPRIVLDVAVEPTLDVALVPLGISCCELARGPSPQTMSRLVCPQRSSLLAEQSSATSDAISSCHHRGDSLLKTTPKSAQDQTRTSDKDHAKRHLPRPHSANSTKDALRTFSHLTSPPNQPQQHLSCQAILVSSTKHTGSGCSGNSPASVRSASACGYDHTKRQQQQQPLIARSTASETRVNVGTCSRSGTCSCSSPPPTTSPVEGGGCSVDRHHHHHDHHSMPAANRATSDRSSWRSINRLIFSPVIKTWSSIQLSFQAASAAQQQQAAAPGSDLTNQCNVDQQRVNNDHQTRSTTLHDDDDILQLSSPARRRLMRNNNKRRMSRSCELVAVTNNGGDTDSINAKSSSINEPTSSSQYDHFDDQRILLATINRLAGENGTNSSNKNGRIEFMEAKQANLTTNTRRCKRCRSWSPALLDKLEDCMYQIKNRIPLNFKTAAKRQHQSSVCHEQMGEQSEFSESNSQQQDGQQDGEKDEKNENYVLIDVYHDDGGNSASSSTGSSCCDDHNKRNKDGHDDEIDLDEDSLHELGLMQQNWNNKKEERLKRIGLSVGQQQPNDSHNCGGRQLGGGRRSRHRLRQQSSTNSSDTLSIRTAGTVLTNVSFDSDSSIPAHEVNMPEATTTAASASTRERGQADQQDG